MLIEINSSGFTKNLSSTDDTLDKALSTLDQLSAGGIDWTTDSANTSEILVNNTNYQQNINVTSGTGDKYLAFSPYPTVTKDKFVLINNTRGTDLKIINPSTNMTDGGIDYQFIFTAPNFTIKNNRYGLIRLKYYVVDSTHIEIRIEIIPFDYKSAGEVITSYDNVGGTGNRNSIITVTTDLSIVGGIPSGISSLVNGNFTAPYSCYCASTGSVTGKRIVIDFGVEVIINEMRYYQSNGNYPQGTWITRGANQADLSDIEDIGSSFILGNKNFASYTDAETLTATSSNTTAYRYYVLEGVSGNSSNAPYLVQLEFKIFTP